LIRFLPKAYPSGCVHVVASRQLYSPNRPQRQSGSDRLGSIAPTSEFDATKTTLIVDPPAAGLTSALRQAIVDFAPATLIYISCNPATLARDLKELKERFVLESVTPLDMFPQTAEIEVVAHLQRSNESAI